MTREWWCGDHTHPTPRRWGIIENGVFRAIPRRPMENALLGPPPFTFTRETDGRVMDIVEEPEANPAS